MRNSFAKNIVQGAAALSIAIFTIARVTFLRRRRDKDQHDVGRADGGQTR